MSDPVYLVSRCSSIEEFVAAFRRYADRLGVFVPAAAPVAVGRKGRFAITLKDGGIVIDGDAEVIMSSSRASGLHGRPGMTLRFTKVDDASRAVLDHLEKVRFGAKVTVPSSHLVARPGPTVPDPGPPAPAKPGTDAAQLLADCVVIGDDAGDRARSAGGSVPPPLGAASSGKFAIPSIPSRVGPGASRPTMMGPAVADPRAPAPLATGASGPNDGVPAAGSLSAAVTIAGGAQTVPTPMHPMSSPPAPPEAVPIETPWLRHTTRGVAPPGTSETELAPVVAFGRGSPPLGETDLATGDHVVVDVPPPPTRKPVAKADPTPPPTPPKRQAAKVDPTPPRPAPPPPAPEPPVLPERRPQPPKTRTIMGLQAMYLEPAPPSSPGIAIPREEPAVVIAPDLDLEPPAPEPALEVAAPTFAPSMTPSQAFARAPTDQPPRGASIEIDPSLLEPTDTQDIIDPATEPTGSNEPVVVTSAWPPPDAAPATPVAASLVPAPPVLPGAPGWTPPPPRNPTGATAAHPGEASSRALTDAGTGFFEEAPSQPRGVGYVTDSNTNFFQETGAQPVIGYVSEDMTALVQASPRQKRLLVIILSCLGVFVLGFVAILVVGGGKSKKSGKPPVVAKAGSGSARSGDGSAGPALIDGSGSALTAGDGSGSALTAGDGSGSALTAGDDSGSALTAGDGSGSALTAGDGSGDGDGSGEGDGDGDGSGATAGGGSGSGKPPGDRVAIAPPPAAACSAKVTSTPSGSDVVVAGKVRGKTPIELQLSCASTQIAVRHARYTTWTKTVKPTAKGIKVNARLDRPTFTVKVSSTPSGATVSVGGKKVGKTPTAVKVPGFQPTTITLSKDGYANATERVTAKQNGGAIKMTLRKK